MKQLFALVLFVLTAVPALARVDGNETALAALAPSSIQSNPDAPRLGAKIGMILDMRAKMTDRMAPQPQADCKDPQAITKRLAALEALDAFVRTTVNGLIDAAPSSDLKAAASEDLAPVLIRHRQDMGATLMDLMELPLVREKSGLSKEIVRLAEQAARP